MAIKIEDVSVKSDPVRDDIRVAIAKLKPGQSFLVSVELASFCRNVWQRFPGKFSGRTENLIMYRVGRTA